jgi:hypothetical protein
MTIRLSYITSACFPGDDDDDEDDINLNLAAKYNVCNYSENQLRRAQQKCTSEFTVALLI